MPAHHKGNGISEPETQTQESAHGSEILPSLLLQISYIVYREKKYIFCLCRLSTYIYPDALTLMVVSFEGEML